MKWAHIKRCKAIQKEVRKQQAKAAEIQAALLKELERLQKQKIEYENKVFELNRMIRRFENGLKSLEKQNDEESKKKKKKMVGRHF